MSLSGALDPTNPPHQLDELHPGTLHVGGDAAPCHIGVMSVRTRRDYFDDWFPGMTFRVAPERFTSMWTSGAEHIVDALPVRDDDLWWRTVHAMPAVWRGDRGETLTGSLLLVDRPRTYGRTTLDAVQYREVWIIGEWTIQLPKELADAMAGGQPETVAVPGR